MIGHWKYYFALITEIVGIILMGAGLFEYLVLGVMNPANWLITCGSVVVAGGSLFFAKIVKWQEYIENK